MGHAGTWVELSRRLCLLVCMVLLCACTSVRPVELSAEELRQQIRTGSLIAPGDRVRIATDSGQTYTFKVTSIDEATVHGPDDHVAIDTIAALRTRDFSAGKTALLAGGAVGMGMIILYGMGIAASVAVMSGP